jgi:hypothetical protein
VLGRCHGSIDRTATDVKIQPGLWLLAMTPVRFDELHDHHGTRTHYFADHFHAPSYDMKVWGNILDQCDARYDH